MQLFFYYFARMFYGQKKRAKHSVHLYYYKCVAFIPLARQRELSLSIVSTSFFPYFDSLHTHHTHTHEVLLHTESPPVLQKKNNLHRSSMS